ncbi:MAG: hypothetical protein FAF04_05710 [Epsilonproteobacteria bacterium]|nr:hypothetical protein [Campylobacterota bacterium]
MKKVVLSALAALTLSSVAANASVKLYQDANGQVFTKPAEGRTEIKTSTPVFSKADKLKFSGLTYIGYTYNNYDKTLANGSLNTREDTSQFEIRRAYFQLKAYLLDDPKSYYRVTLDVHQDNKIDATGNGTTDGDMLLRIKYAYLYINNILPHTGVELGIAHRPWHDYEEHTAWYFRDVSKVLIEQKNGADLSNSADFGFNFKTKTKYFDSELGLFNGEGYHALQAQKGMSFEWRTTGHILGVNGKDKEKELTYWDVSFFGQYNQDHKETATAGQYDDLVFGGLHTVYNQPEFLVSAQYVKSLDTRDGSASSMQDGEGYSVNAEYRLGAQKEYRIFGRFDSWTPGTDDGQTEYEQKTYIAGAAWDQNKNVQWVANVDITDNDAGSGRESYNGTAYMLTAQVKF